MRGWILAAALTIGFSPVGAQVRPADGTLLSSKPCAPNPIRSYAQYRAGVRAALAEEADYAKAEGIAMPVVTDERLARATEPAATVADHIAYRGFECRAIVYASGGLKIAGFLWKPRDTAGRHLPLLIANRGGNADFGAMDPWLYWGWHDFLKAGYVVLASQYRGGPGSEGQDEYGGGDLDDARALVPLARGLGYVDTDNIFLFGGSRGGAETYMLLRDGFPARAAAIRAGIADLFRAAEQRPALERNVFARWMRDYGADRDAALAKRSAVRWPERIRAPTIIFQGSDDWRVSPRDALDMAGAFQRNGTPFELHLYQGDTHAMTLNEADMIARTLQFFERYRSSFAQHR